MYTCTELQLYKVSYQNNFFIFFSEYFKIEPKEIKYLPSEKLSDLDLNVNEIEPLIHFLVENSIYLWNYEFVVCHTLISFLLFFYIYFFNSNNFFFLQEANSELFPEFMKITGGIACFQSYPDIYWI